MLLKELLKPLGFGTTIAVVNRDLWGSDVSILKKEAVFYGVYENFSWDALSKFHFCKITSYAVVEDKDGTDVLVFYYLED